MWGWKHSLSHVRLQSILSQTLLALYLLQYVWILWFIFGKTFPVYSYLPKALQELFAPNSFYSHLLRFFILPIHTLLSTISYAHIRKYFLQLPLNNKYRALNSLLPILDPVILLFPWTILSNILAWGSLPFFMLEIMQNTILIHLDADKAWEPVDLPWRRQLTDKERSLYRIESYIYLNGFCEQIVRVEPPGFDAGLRA